MIKYYWTDGFFWVRIFDVGFEAKNTTKRTLSFSQRYGYKKYIKLGKWAISYLPKVDYYILPAFKGSLEITEYLGIVYSKFNSDIRNHFKRDQLND